MSVAEKGPLLGREAFEKKASAEKNNRNPGKRQGRKGICLIKAKKPQRRHIFGP
jgi:hypothetical protein